MAKPTIKLYVDTVSPYAYEAYYLLRHDAIFRDCDISYVPIFLGGLMKMCGNTPPIHIKNKDKWIVRERVRWASAFGIPMRHDPPRGFPPPTLGTMRALAVLDGHRLTRMLDVLFPRYWVDHAPVHEPAVLRSALEHVLGADEADTVLSDAATKGKTVLAENTARAFAEGAFGLPWMVCTNARGETEGFWGVDHLGQLIQFLGLEKPVEGGWKSLL